MFLLFISLFISYFNFSKCDYFYSLLLKQNTLNLRYVTKRSRTLKIRVFKLFNDLLKILFDVYYLNKVKVIL